MVGIRKMSCPEDVWMRTKLWSLVSSDVSEERKVDGVCYFPPNATRASQAVSPLRKMWHYRRRSKCFWNSFSFTSKVSSYLYYVCKLQRPIETYSLHKHWLGTCFHSRHFGTGSVVKSIGTEPMPGLPAFCLPVRASLFAYPGWITRKAVFTEIHLIFRVELPAVKVCIHVLRGHLYFTHAHNQRLSYCMWFCRFTPQLGRL